ncbi:hypothetical protein MVEN_01255100 [Mycena venus]|uniref:Uncharacterized protein n=1 Tax=Mycena venus TaxID=2733690 RepID=A0A8H6Y6R8_9AGAR|nr:hypothetical protein MVEN_01255100 [Mycena venus]
MPMVPSTRPSMSAPCARSFPTRGQYSRPYKRPRVLSRLAAPHTREVCRNRTAHPRFDVLYLKNAEVDSFNGCGYCKWARTSPPPKAAGYFNTGWPGCCRAPTTSEHRLIQPADWRSVSLVHHVPIPSDVKAALDNLSSRGTGSPGPSVSPVRSSTSTKVDVRRNSTSGRSSAKSAAMPIPTKGRTSGSPQMVASSITSTSSRGSGSSGGTSISVPNASSMEQAQAHAHRKQRDTAAESEKPPGSSNSSPGRKHIDLDNTVTPRRNSGGRTPASAASSTAVSKVIADALTSGTQERRRRSNSSTQPSSLAKASSPVSPKTSSPPVRPVDTPKSQKKGKGDIENLCGNDPPRPPKKTDPETSSTSSSGSESTGSMTSTVTSTGEFTDYLSDESEAELQRQAEAKAALVAQNEAEEMEFRAARQALANIGLRPPKSWVATETERSAARVASTRS